MNHVFSMSDNNYEDYACMYLRSLYKHSPDCHLIFAGHKVDQKKIEGAWPGTMHFIKIPSKAYEGRIATVKIELIHDCNFMYEDNVLALDVDMIIQKDPFIIFDETDADVIVTGRCVKFKHPINGGVWGFRYNGNGKQFIMFHKKQVHQKDWKPYRKYLKKFGHLDLVNWSVGQDFLNVIHKTNLPFPCKVKDVGWKWNYCLHAGSSSKYKTFEELRKSAHFQETERRYKAAVGDPNINIIHYKSKMKFLMKEYDDGQNQQH